MIRSWKEAAEGMIIMLRLVVSVWGVLLLIVAINTLVEETRIFTTPGSKGFWDDALAHHLKTSGHKTEEQLIKQYGHILVFTGLGGAFVPSEKVAQLNAVTQVTYAPRQKGPLFLVSFAVAALLFGYVPMLAAVRNASRWVTWSCMSNGKAREIREQYFRRYPLGAYVLSILSVIASCWLQAVEFSTRAVRAAGVSIPYLTVALIVLAYFTGMWSKIVAYLLDFLFVLCRINPKHTFWDEFIAFALTAPVLYFVYRNSILAIFSATLAGLFPSILGKIWLRVSATT